MKKSMSAAVKGLFASDVKNIQFKDIQSGLKGFILKVVLFIEKNKHNAWLVAPLALGSILLAGFFVLKINSQLKQLTTQESELSYLETYDINMLKTNQNTRKEVNNLRSVEDLIAYYEEKKADTERYKTYLGSLKVPYDYLLQYLYLPRLNIWKDPYLGTIDTNLIGRNFLEQNPYDDILLLQKWSDFFKQVGQNETNQITDISIGDIRELGDTTFKIAIKVSFISSSKRAFLLLADKLSLTSNETNLSLMNEFMYYMWLEIKKSKTLELENLSSSLIEAYPDTFGTETDPNYDKIIGYHLYQWIKDGGANMLIDEPLLLRTMNAIISCQNTNPEICMYQFREKYRTVPYLAYLFKGELASNPLESFRNFLANIPPIISIGSFTFDKIQMTQFSNNISNQYQGQVNIEINGKGVSEEEVQEIGLLLGNQCFKQNKLMSAKEGISIIEELSQETTDSVISEAIQANYLRELEEILKKIEKEYDRLPNYNKIIRIFEINRMLEDANLCEA